MTLRRDSSKISHRTKLVSIIFGVRVRTNHVCRGGEESQSPGLPPGAVRGGQEHGGPGRGGREARAGDHGRHGQRDGAGAGPLCTGAGGSGGVQRPRQPPEWCRHPLEPTSLALLAVMAPARIACLTGFLAWSVTTQACSTFRADRPTTLGLF
jgi:hypothetical protein